MTASTIAYDGPTQVASVVAEGPVRLQAAGSVRPYRCSYRSCKSSVIL